MAKKDPGLVSDRPVISIRPPTDLKRRLEEAATKSGRSVGREAEHRLEASFEERPPQKLDDPLPGIFSDEVRRALRGSPALAQVVEAVADTLLHTIRAANERGREERDVRTAARAALNVVADNFMWRGDDKETPIDGPLASLGTRKLDYPPAHLGYEIAHQRLTWLSTWHEEGAAVDTLEKRIRNRYSGDGRTTVFGPSREETADSEAAARREAKDPLNSSALRHEDHENLHKYKSVDGLASDDKTS